MPSPQVVVFDVNETLSDMRPLTGRFTDLGAAPHLADLWFAALLRDGFALTAVGQQASFGALGRDLLAAYLRDVVPVTELDAAVEHVMAGFAGLGLHPDVVPGLTALHGAGVRLVTLSNGAAAVAERLLTDAGLRPLVEQVLSVDDAGIWKPAPAAYRYAAQACGVPADQLLMVAVHPWDIHGAACAGLATAWLDRGNLPYPSYFRAPDHVIHAVSDLVSLVRHPA